MCFEDLVHDSVYKFFFPYVSTNKEIMCFENLVHASVHKVGVFANDKDSCT